MPAESLTTETQLITSEVFAAMSDVDGYELIKGRIVPVAPPPTPEHGECEIIIGAALLAFVRAHNLGRVSGGEASLITRRNPDTVRGADLLFISHARLTPGAFKSPLEVAPDLVVEVVSKWDRWTEINRKIQEYFAFGVRLVWIVDPDAREVYVYTSPNQSLTFGVDSALTGDDVLPGFALPVAEIFVE